MKIIYLALLAGLSTAFALTATAQQPSTAAASTNATTNTGSEPTAVTTAKVVRPVQPVRHRVRPHRRYLHRNTAAAKARREARRRAVNNASTAVAPPLPQ